MAFFVLTHLDQWTFRLWQRLGFIAIPAATKAIKLLLCQKSINTQVNYKIGASINFFYNPK